MYGKILIAVLLFCLPAFAGDDSELIGIVNGLKENVKPENNEYNDDINKVYETMKEAKPVEVKIPSYDVFQEDRSEILSMFSLPEPKGNPEDGQSCVDPEMLGDYRVFVFISSSMPETTLKHYMRDAKKLNDTLLVMRGVIGSVSEIKPTLNFMTKISCNKEFKDLRIDDNCPISRVDINPLLFSLFGVKQVPAIVFSKLSYNELLIRENMEQPLKDDEYFIIRGDMELSYAFEKFEKAGAGVLKYIETLNGVYGGEK